MMIRTKETNVEKRSSFSKIKIPDSFLSNKLLTKSNKKIKIKEEIKREFKTLLEKKIIIASGINIKNKKIILTTSDQKKLIYLKNKYKEYFNQRLIDFRVARIEFC